MELFFPKVRSESPMDDMEMYNPYRVVVMVVAGMQKVAKEVAIIWENFCFIFLEEAKLMQNIQNLL